MRKIILLFSIAILFQSVISAQILGKLIEAKPNAANMSNKHLALLDQHIQSYVDDGKVPGGVFLVARQGKIVYFNSFGKRSDKKKDTYKKDDIFRIASMTKAVTTVSILQLYEQGKLKLDDPVHKYIPAFKEMKVLDTFNDADSTFTTKPATKPITLRNLLTHTSGITYGGFNPGKVQIVYEQFGLNNFGLSNTELTTEGMVNKIATAPLIFNPGDKYMYGLNMEVLGRVIEVVSGQSLDQYFSEHIFEPLGMKNTFFYLPKKKRKNLVPVYTTNQTGKVELANDFYQKLFSYPKNEEPISHFAGGGGLSSNTMDYTIFIQMLLNNGTYNGARILGRKSIEVMTSDQMRMQNAMGTGYSKLPGVTHGLGFQLLTEEAAGLSHKSPGTYEWGGYFNTKFFIDPAEDLIFVGMTQVLPFYYPDFWDKMYAIIYGSID